MPMRYWVMRTDRRRKAYLFEELRNGNLRQGWGNLASLDLRQIKQRVLSGQPLSEDQRAAWRRNRRLLAEEPDGIKQGDLVLLPNLPEERTWSVARVLDDHYEYEISPEHGDYGHTRRVQLLNPATPINPYSRAVSAHLRGTMQTQLPLWNIDGHEEGVNALLAALREEGAAQVTVAESGEERLAGIRDALVDQLWDHLKQRFRGGEFEGPCGRLLGLLYETVEHSAGTNERGADFICDYSDGLGIQHRVAVQVKMWEGEGDLGHPIRQIRDAYLNYAGITSAAILTTLDAVAEPSQRAVEDLSLELGIPIKVLTKDEVLELFVRHLSDMTVAFD